MVGSGWGMQRNPVGRLSEERKEIVPIDPDLFGFDSTLIESNMQMLVMKVRT